MRNNCKRIIISILLGILFVSLTLSNIQIIYKQGIHEEIIKDRDEMNLKSPRTSGYWTLGFIHIDNNWTDALLEDWCNGEGSWDNPYVIENVSIDASGSPTGNGILINNSKEDYFIIRNCTVYNALAGKAGISLLNTNNSTLINNNCSNSGGRGIYLELSDDNTIIGNIASDNNEHGIALLRSSFNNISENTANDNTVQGIRLRDYCNNNTISGNTLKRNIDGIRLRNECDNNIISGNTANNNGGNGIYLLEYNNNNKISGNIENNNGGNGIYLYYYCNDNKISGNTANSNAGNGIYLLDGCDGNIISGNMANNNVGHGLCLEGTETVTAPFRYCDYNTILENTICYNSLDGIRLTSLCYDNTISGNNISQNLGHGISLFDDCDYNIISNNTINSNSLNGIHGDPQTTHTCNNNTIKENYICYNGQRGVMIYAHCDYNLFCLNNFIDNVGENARDLGSNNKWDNGLVGNYWGDYSGVDIAPLDGIGDDTYHISLHGNDTKPLMFLPGQDPDNDGLNCLEEYTLGDDGFMTNPVDPDTDDDSFNDGSEFSHSTNPLDPSWYPMPNLKVSYFSSVTAYEKTSFKLDFSITNDGIWSSEDIFIIIRCEGLDLTLFNNELYPFNLAVDETMSFSIGCPPINNSGVYSIYIIVDPNNLINELYSLKNGSLRSDWENDNFQQVDLTIIPEFIPETTGDDDFLIIITTVLGVFSAISGVGVILLLGVNKNMKKKFNIVKKQLNLDKTKIQPKGKPIKDNK